MIALEAQWILAGGFTTGQAPIKNRALEGRVIISDAFRWFHRRLISFVPPGR